MKTSFYLIVNSRGATRTTKTLPGLDFNEISIKLDLVLPDTLFKKPQLSANINVKEDDVRPFEINAETVNDIQTAIRQHTGIPVVLKIVEEEKERP